jgi:penicillin amidase
MVDRKEIIMRKHHQEKTMLTTRTKIIVSFAPIIFAAFLFENLLAALRTTSSQDQANASQEQASATRDHLPGLIRRVTVERDLYGVPHVKAFSDHDAYFMMGYLHAQDRFFQMDLMRRRGNGTSAELLGAGPQDIFLGDDIFFRFIGIARSAERSLCAYSSKAASLLQAYSDGVNVWLESNPLPPEYPLLEVTQVPKWKPVDSLAILKLIQFQAAVEFLEPTHTDFLSRYQIVGQARGFDGSRLFFEDIFRFAPFDPVVTIPDPAGAAPLSSPQTQSAGIESQILQNARQAQEVITPDVLEAARKFAELFNHTSALKRAGSEMGSNWWVVAGSKTATGNAMLASDPHLGLGTPSTFYEIHLTVEANSSPMNVYGVSFAGIPSIFFGQNERISWGATIATLDVADFFAESLVIVNGAPIATRYKGVVEPLTIIPEEFKVNQVQNGAADDVIAVSPGNRPSGLPVPPAFFIAPRRNDGPVFPGNSSGGISFQYTGSSATRDLEGLFALARARNLADFKRGLRLIEVGPLNWAYADVDGNIATFVSGKVPLREDLRSGTIDGLPPFLLRDGTGAARNEWIPRNDDGPGFKYESIPFEDMPQAVNPSQGFLVNANNDPIGVTLDNNPLNQVGPEGIYYISSRFNAGFRAAKITDLLARQFDCNFGNGKVSFQEMQRIQGNVQMFDAEVFTPYIIQAFNAARSAGAPADLAALANDPAVSEAVGRLSNWDFSTPTGISEGYDANDINGIRLPPSNNEAANSVAATIYTVWRRQMLVNTILGTLQRVGLEPPDISRTLVALRFLLDNFAINHGVGSSGLDFFEIPGVNAPPEIRRDAIILKSLKDALSRLAGNSFADAFGRSTNQNDYRWGKLHRVTFSHPFGNLAPQFSVPTSGNFENLSPTLPGLATDGGYETIDIASYNPLAASSQSYTFGGGPVRRYVGELRRHRIRSVQIIPGGESGVLGDQFFSNQLSKWLTNDYHRVLFTADEIESKRFSKVVYRPVN